MRMRLAWKKSQKTLDASKRLHKNKTRSTGSVDKGTWSQLLPLLGLRTRKSAGTSSLSNLVGCEMSWPGRSYNRVLIGVPPIPKVVFKIIEPKRIDSLLYAMIDFVNHGIQGTATWSQLSFVPPKNWHKTEHIIICSSNRWDVTDFM